MVGFAPKTRRFLGGTPATPVDPVSEEKAKRDLLREYAKMLDMAKAHPATYSGQKNPCLICNPDTTKDMQTMFSNGDTRAPSLIVICEDCKRGVMAFREIAL